MAVGTTRGKRRLGRFVRPLRERSGLSIDQVAERVTCSAHTIQRMERGESLPSRSRLAAILAVAGVSDTERATALALWDVANVPGAQVQHAEELPPAYRRFRLDESEAAAERTLDMILIPGLLQTTEYATALSAGARRFAGTDRWRVHAGAERAERQALLTRAAMPLRYHALISVSALRTVIGSRRTMVDQLTQVLTLAERPSITVQALPDDMGAHEAMSGPLTLLDYDDEESSAYAESVLGPTAVQQPASIEELSGVWQDVAASAPSPEASAAIIEHERAHHLAVEEK